MSRNSFSFPSYSVDTEDCVIVLEIACQQWHVKDGVCSPEEAGRAHVMARAVARSHCVARFGGLGVRPHSDSDLPTTVACPSSAHYPTKICCNDVKRFLVEPP